MELDRDTIQTTIQDGQILQSVYNDSPINFSSIVQDVPQLQTVIQDNLPAIVTVVEAPWVAVTSVNGMTGDVITKATVGNFTPNTYYEKNSLVVYGGKLYYAKNGFTSGQTFDENDWVEVSGSGGVANITSDDHTVTVVIGDESVDLSIADTLQGYIQKETGKGLSSNDYTTAEKNKLDGIESGAQKNVQSDWTASSGDAFIKNKPTLATVATSGAYNDLSGKPTIPTVNNGTLTIKQGTTTIATFSANSSSNVTATISAGGTLYNSTGHNTDGAMTQNASTLNFLTSSTVGQLEDISFLNRIYPVGSIYISVTLDTITKVHNALGGTWEVFGAGRVLVGVDTSQTEFDTVMETGGEKAHQLTTAEMPSHRHMNLYTYDGSIIGTGGGSATTTKGYIPNGNYSYGSISTGYEGSSSSHNNLQPYITAYMYRRIA